MHTIDLLRGQGIPAKTTLGSAAMIVVIIAVPILAAAGMVDRYMQNDIDIGKKQQEISNEQETIDEFADAVKFKETILEQQIAIHSKLLEVSSCLDKYIQWSPVLETLARYMPSKMVMDELRADCTSGRQRRPSEKNPNRTVNVIVYERKMVLLISGSEQVDYGSEVERYKNRLQSSSVLGPKLEDIIVSENPGRSGDENTVSYTMNLMFKSETL